eukprot:tig00000219_g19460.t1
MRRRQAGYEQVAGDETDAAHAAPAPRSRVPEIEKKKEFALALVLLTIGSFTLTWGILLAARVVQADSKHDMVQTGRALMVLGGICFTPGIWGCCMAYFSWRGYRDWTWDQLPSY